MSVLVRSGYRAGDHVRGIIRDPLAGAYETTGVVIDVTATPDGYTLRAAMRDRNGVACVESFALDEAGRYEGAGLSKSWPQETLAHLRREYFYPRDVHVPPLQGTDEYDAEHKVVAVTYRLGTCVWHIAEADPATGDAFGWAEVTPGFGEWGSISLTELEQLRLDTPEGVALIRRVTAPAPVVFADVIY